jgi:hypothetical protein
MHFCSYIILAISTQGVRICKEKVMVHNRQSFEIVTVTHMSSGIDHKFYI